MDAAAGRDQCGDEVRDPLGGQRTDREPVALERHGAEGRGGCPASVAELGDAQADPVGGDDLVERPRRDDPAVVEDDHAVAHPLDLGQQVRVEDHRGATVTRGAHDRPDVGATDGIERRCRLVEQDEVGVAEQRDAEPEPLLHPLREAR